MTEFLPCADILKLSDEELFFVTGKEHIEDAVEELFAMGISVILYTKGSQGAEVYTRTAHVAVSGTGKKAVDTTGAGDIFHGAFTYCIHPQPANTILTTVLTIQLLLKAVHCLQKTLLIYISCDNF